MMSKALRKTIIIIFWLTLWGLVSCLVGNPVLMAGPGQVLGRLMDLARETLFYKTVVVSVLRIGLGFGIGFLLAVLLAVGSNRFPLLEELLSPMVSLLKTVPMASVVVLLLIWWGTVALSTVVSMLVVFPICYIQMLEGMKHLDRELFEMAEVFHIPFAGRLFYLYNPALKPYLFGSLKTALGMSWKSGVAAEIIGMVDTSVGGQLYLSKVYLDTVGVFAWTCCVMIISYLFERFVMALAGSYMSLQPRCKRPVRESDRCREIGLREVYKRFGEISVFEKRSVTYRQGEIYYLREPSGAGKTTLLKLLAGLVREDAGEVVRPTSCSMMFQEDRLCMEYSAVKNVALVTGDEESARIALEKLLDKEVLDKPCRELSGGMKRRVALVRAMESDASWVFLDEPFTGMDEETALLADRYIRDRKGDRCLIIATHVLKKHLKSVKHF